MEILEEENNTGSS